LLSEQGGFTFHDSFRDTIDESPYIEANLIISFLALSDVMSDRVLFMMLAVTSCCNSILLIDKTKLAAQN